MKIFVLSFLYFFACSSKSDQQNTRLLGGPCEGCEAVLEYDDPNINAVDTLPDFDRKGPKIKLTGTVYKPGGEKPAANIILYIHHTDQKGIYPTTGQEKGWGRRHGYLRGWVKTNEKGEYAFYTLRPAHYPNRTDPAHVHLTILESNGRYYYVEDFLFDDDPKLTNDRRTRIDPRGGKGFVLTLKKEGDLMVGKRDIILGKNIPGYE